MCLDLGFRKIISLRTLAQLTGQRLTKCFFPTGVMFNKNIQVGVVSLGLMLFNKLLFKCLLLLHNSCTLWYMYNKIYKNIDIFAWLETNF